MAFIKKWVRSCILVALAGSAWAQFPPQGRGGAPLNPRAGAPIDLTGYWVSIVTEDWRFRMFTPPKGDFAGVPLNSEGMKAGQAWDPAKDEAAGEQCKSYGMPAIMRVPGRFHITWDNDTTPQPWRRGTARGSRRQGRLLASRDHQPPPWLPA